MKRQKLLSTPHKFIGRIDACPNRLLLGGKKRVESVPFSTREEAQAYCDAMLQQTNAATAQVIPV